VYGTDAAKETTEFFKLDVPSDVKLYQINQSSSNCLTVAATNQRRPTDNTIRAGTD